LKGSAQDETPRMDAAITGRTPACFSIASMAGPIGKSVVVVMIWAHHNTGAGGPIPAAPAPKKEIRALRADQ
jgi:hypothetical protein